jgi:hypothetical protein
MSKNDICPKPNEFVVCTISDNSKKYFQLSPNENTQYILEQWINGKWKKVSKQFAKKRINLIVKQTNFIDCPGCEISQPFHQVINLSNKQFKCEFCNEHFNYLKLRQLRF